MRTKLSAQAQFLHDPNRDLAFLRVLRPKWVKYHQPDPNRIRELLDMGLYVCLRDHGISEQHGLLAADPEALGDAHAEYWQNKLTGWGFDDSDLSRLAVEGINEPAVSNPEQAARVNQYGVAFAGSAALHGIRVATPNLSTGWPYNHGPDTPPDYEPFRELVDALRITGSYWASHEYWDRRGPASDDWLWNPGRILQRPAWFRDVKILITECGYDQAVNAPAGTRHHSWNGHMPAQEYAANHLGAYDYRMQADPDVEALMVFLLDTDNEAAWWTFDVAPCRQEILTHAEWLRNQPEPDDWGIYLPIVAGPAPTPTPPEPPDEPQATDLVSILARLLNVPPTHLQAVLAVESNSRPFAEDGRLLIRFEVHIFWDLWGKDHAAAFNDRFRFDRDGKRWEGHSWRNGPDWAPVHDSQHSEWIALGIACSLGREAALKSVAMGAGQVMGFNHELVGYSTVEEMFRSYEASVTNQIMGVALFVVAKDLVGALRDGDWLAFATVYNGLGNAEEYARRLREAAGE